MPNDIVKFRKLHKLHEAVEFTIFLLELADPPASAWSASDWRAGRQSGIKKLNKDYGCGGLL